MELRYNYSYGNYLRNISAFFHELSSNKTTQPRKTMLHLKRIVCGGQRIAQAGDPAFILAVNVLLDMLCIYAARRELRLRVGL